MGGKWIEWAGGECPVEPGQVIDAKLRAYAGFSTRPANQFRWWHGPAGDPHDLVAYRVVTAA